MANVSSISIPPTPHTNPIALTDLCSCLCIKARIIATLELYGLDRLRQSDMLLHQYLLLPQQRADQHAAVQLFTPLQITQQTNSLIEAQAQLPVIPGRLFF